LGVKGTSRLEEDLSKRVLGGANDGGRSWYAVDGRRTEGEGVGSGWAFPLRSPNKRHVVRCRTRTKTASKVDEDEVIAVDATVRGPQAVLGRHLP